MVRWALLIAANVVVDGKRGLRSRPDGPFDDVIFTGMVRHGAEISSTTLDFLVDVTCKYNTKVHILGADDMEVMDLMYNRLKQEKYPGQQCGELLIEIQPDFISQEKHRIVRVEFARNYQRHRIGTVYNIGPETTVVMADMDISQLPPIPDMLATAKKIGVDRVADVICANGLLAEGGYYDTFATILLPDTFVYPVNGRPNVEARPVEDPTLIVDNNFTNIDLMNYFLDHGKQEGSDTYEPVPVKSCFGGLAIYKADKWLEERCSYHDKDVEGNALYANRFDMMPCEHVIIHRCMQKYDPSTVVAVQPDLHTVWHTGSGPDYALANFPDLAKSFLRQKFTHVSDLPVEPHHISREMKEGTEHERLFEAAYHPKITNCQVSCEAGDEDCTLCPESLQELLAVLDPEPEEGQEEERNLQQATIYHPAIEGCKESCPDPVGDCIECPNSLSGLLAAIYSPVGISSNTTTANTTTTNGTSTRRALVEVEEEEDDEQLSRKLNMLIEETLHPASNVTTTMNITNLNTTEMLSMFNTTNVTMVMNLFNITNVTVANMLNTTNNITSGSPPVVDTDVDDSMLTIETVTDVPVVLGTNVLGIGGSTRRRTARVRSRSASTHTNKHVFRGFL